MSRRDGAQEVLARSLCARLHDATLVRARSRPWASATFSGERHAFVLRVTGHDAGTVARRFVRDGAEAEIKLEGQLLADLSVSDCKSGPDWAEITIEALTVEAA
jgi:hypothetical protein